MIRQLSPDNTDLTPEERKAVLIASTLGLTISSQQHPFDGTTVYSIHTSVGHELNRTRFIKTIIANLDTLVATQRVFGNSYVISDTGGGR